MKRFFAGLFLSVVLTGLAVAAPVIPIDFSYAGYEAGAEIPSVIAVLRVQPTGGDDTAMLQAAIARVAEMPRATNGFRGAIELAGGEFFVGGQLALREDGVVLRGSRDRAHPTVVIATGTDRRALIQIGAIVPPAETGRFRVVDESVPVGGCELTLETTDGLAVGSRIVVRRPTAKEWVAALGMDKFEGPGAFPEQRLQWFPRSRDLVWDRIITRIDAIKKRITLDAPLTTALEQKFGGGSVALVQGSPVRHVGVEHLVLESAHASANPRDEDHAWIGVALDGVEDAWMRDVTARYFSGSAVRVGWHGRRITVVNCRSEKPVAEIGGYRRQGFLVEGQQTLVRDCTAEAGTNDFAVGLCAAGPNVFLNCSARGALGANGSFESWASGVLYERVSIEGAPLKLARDNTRAQGAGWTAANSVAWNCRASAIETLGPEGAPNITVDDERSLYADQLEKRLGRANTLAGAEVLTGGSIADFTWSAAGEPRVKPPAPRRVEISGGRFVVGGEIVWGGAINAAWWKGQASPGIALDAGLSITRFVPGRIEPGLTEDLPALAARMEKDGMVFYQSVPGLWYDRRRDDHQLVSRPDGNVWAPFYELPWARSGQGTAWDGLSKYDLTKYNPWFFSRVREFAALSDAHGLLLFHNLYNTHNVLETEAHYVDFPWRPANCINDVGIPEPPPLDERNTVHLATTFYNIDHPGRRALHRAYIFHTLDELGGADNVIFGLAFQFAGPLAFQQFFLDTVAEWEQRTGRKVRIALTTSKDITDAILADPVRSRLIAVIDMRYWQMQPDGKLWAPRGDLNRAFREQNTVIFGRGVDTPPDTTPLNVYRGVREYRDRFPDRAVVAWHGGAGPIPVLMAGGAHALMRNPSAGQSQGVETDAAAFARFARAQLGAVLAQMTPRDGWLAEPDSNWCLADAGDNVLIYSLGGAAIILSRDLPQAKYEGMWFDPRTGETRPFAPPARFVAETILAKPSAENWLLRLRAIRR